MALKPGTIHRFSLNSGYQSDLDGGTISLALEDAFRDAGHVLPGDASLSVDEAGSQWTIETDDITYEIVKTEGELAVYPQDFGDSLAAAIEEAFERAWTEVNGSGLPEKGRRDRRILFVGVAQGVIKYLKQHAADGFDIEAEAVQKDSTEITSSGSLDEPGYQHIDVTVTQDSGADNKVIGEIEPGDGKLSINTEGLYS
jgi:hypothetical protein